MFAGIAIIVAMTIITVIAMVTDLHDMNKQIKSNNNWIKEHE